MTIGWKLAESSPLARGVILAYRRFRGVKAEFDFMMRKSTLLLTVTAAVLAMGGGALAQTGKSFSRNEGMFVVAVRSLADRIEQVIANFPALGAYVLGLPRQFGWRQTAFLIGIVVVGLAAEWATRLLLARAVRRIVADQACVLRRLDRRPQLGAGLGETQLDGLPARGAHSSLGQVVRDQDICDPRAPIKGLRPGSPRRSSPGRAFRTSGRATSRP